MHTRIEHLSLAALRMAASGLSEDTGVVARWLYHFGTVPRGPAIDRDFGPDDDPMAVLGKLYISPTPEALADAFPRIADELVRSDVRSFKVGRGIEGLLRPDKIIAYFEDHAYMKAVAGALDRSLSGCPVQGVPFTAEAAGNGLLSSGVDPPPGNAAASWRSWVTKRLAASLTAQRATPCEDPVAGALADIRLAGVDPKRWLPNADAF